MDGDSSNRRIVPREKAAGAIGWRPSAASLWSRFKDRRVPKTATVEDLSLIGARLVVPRTRSLAVGSYAAIEVSGDEGMVEVRWVEPLPDDDKARVGVEFRTLSDALTQRVNSLVANGREEMTEWRWRIAR